MAPGSTLLVAGFQTKPGAAWTWLMPDSVGNKVPEKMKTHDAVHLIDLVWGPTEFHDVIRLLLALAKV